jgi:excinuclease ABC subunit C
MQKQDSVVMKLPDNPGVYFFLGKRREILYIGKATSLKNRVRSYFSDDLKEKRSELIEKMVQEAESVDFTTTDSVLEALILETNLIRTHKPRYNTRSKDDKSYNHLIITKEEWPRVLVVREKDITENFAENEVKYDFGPFTSGSLFREALKVVRKLFKFYDTKIPIGQEKSKMAKGRIDFNQQIGLYPDQSNHKEYLKTINQLQLFFQGMKDKIVEELNRDMMRLAKKEEFEKAEVIKRKIFALKHIQDISLIKDDYKTYKGAGQVRIEAYDVAHYRGKDMVGVMTVIESGEVNKGQYRKFKIKTLTDANDPAALKELLERRLIHSEWPMPEIIVVDGNSIQKNAAEKVIRKHNLMIPVVAVVKDDRHQVSRIIASKKILDEFKFDILLANSEAHRFAIGFYRNLTRKKLLGSDL